MISVDKFILDKNAKIYFTSFFMTTWTLYVSVFKANFTPLVDQLVISCKPFMAIPLTSSVLNFMVLV